MFARHATYLCHRVDNGRGRFQMDCSYCLGIRVPHKGTINVLRAQRLAQLPFNSDNVEPGDAPEHDSRRGPRGLIYAAGDKAGGAALHLSAAERVARRIEALLDGCLGEGETEGRRSPA